MIGGLGDSMGSSTKKGINLFEMLKVAINLVWKLFSSRLKKMLCHRKIFIKGRLEPPRRNLARNMQLHGRSQSEAAAWKFTHFNLELWIQRWLVRKLCQANYLTMLCNSVFACSWTSKHKWCDVLWHFVHTGLQIVGPKKVICWCCMRGRPSKWCQNWGAIFWSQCHQRPKYLLPAENK